MLKLKVALKKNVIIRKNVKFLQNADENVNFTEIKIEFVYLYIYLHFTNCSV